MSIFAARAVASAMGTGRRFLVCFPPYIVFQKGTFCGLTRCLFVCYSPHPNCEGKTKVKCPIIPISDYIVVEEIKVEKTEAGIVLPDTGERLVHVATGKVLACGPGEWMYNLETPRRSIMTVTVGATVLFSPNHPDVEVNGIKYKVFREGELIGIKDSSV